jgi:DNA-binding MarR family transcriptional regulator
MPTPNRQCAELASELRVAIMRLSRRLRRERPDAGLTPTQLAALGTLELHGAMTPTELASRERVRPPSMTRTLACLDELGLVERTGHPTDGRQQLVAIAASGRELLREDRSRREAWLAQRLSELTQDERATLREAARLLERLSAA